VILETILPNPSGILTGTVALVLVSFTAKRMLHRGKFTKNKAHNGSSSFIVPTELLNRRGYENSF